MRIEQSEVLIETPDGQMPAVLVAPTQPDLFELPARGRRPAILLLMEAFGLTSHIRDVAARIANEGYVVLIPDLYYRELPHNKFGYDEVEAARAMALRLDLKSTEADIEAALAYLKSRSNVYPDKVGVTGFCLGGGLALLTACKFPSAIAAVASFYGFYGIALEDWFAMLPALTAPAYFFLGEADPFIPLEQVNQFETRLQELGKDYTLKVYPNADHGFFCNERSNYNQSAAEDAWRELIRFFQQQSSFTLSS